MHVSGKELLLIHESFQFLPFLEKTGIGTVDVGVALAHPPECLVEPWASLLDYFFQVFQGQVGIFWETLV